jgi:branched-chain amino acid transport system ATP-binding protein
VTGPATRTAASPTDGSVELRLTDIHTYYGHIHALQGISLEVRHGEIVTLLGANGAGKTTTLKTIHGLLHPREGRIEFEGRDITRMPAHEHVAVGIGQAPEGRRIFARMTVLENLQMGAYSRRDVRTLDDDFNRVFELFPVLKERRSQVAGTLSGGEQQMLAIGRALMIRPRLLMLDEPSLGLSPILVEEIFSIITDINRQGATILLVEQNALMALGVANRGYVLQTGRIVRAGEAKELLQDEEVRKAYLGG